MFPNTTTTSSSTLEALASAIQATPTALETLVSAFQATPTPFLTLVSALQATETTMQNATGTHPVVAATSKRRDVNGIIFLFEGCRPGGNSTDCGAAFAFWIPTIFVVVWLAWFNWFCFHPTKKNNWRSYEAAIQSQGGQAGRR